MSEVQTLSPEAKEEAKREAARERMRQVRAGKKDSPAEPGIDKDSLVKEVTAGVLGALKEAGVFAVNPATRPPMGRTNPGTPPALVVDGYKCRCGLVHTPDMHYGVKIEPGFHYCNVEDFPSNDGIASDVPRLETLGFEVALKKSERHFVMRAPEHIAMKSRDEAAQASRQRVHKRSNPEASANASIAQGKQEAGFDEIKSGAPIHIDLNRGPVGDIDETETGDHSPDY